MNTQEIASVYEEAYRKVFDEYGFEPGDLGLMIDDETNPFLEVELPTATFEVFNPDDSRWVTVDYLTFRSWTGQRKINGELYKGDCYFFLTKQEVYLH